MATSAKPPTGGAGPEHGPFVPRCSAMEQHSTTYRAALSPEDQALDDLWRKHFGQPLPIMGAGETVKQILLKRGVTEDQIRRAIHRHAPAR